MTQALLFSPVSEYDENHLLNFRKFPVVRNVSCHSRGQIVIDVIVDRNSYCFRSRNLLRCAKEGKKKEEEEEEEEEEENTSVDVKKRRGSGARAAHILHTLLLHGALFKEA